MAKDAQDLWWGLYQENLSHARHHEQQRTAITGYFAAIAAGILGLVSFDKCINLHDTPLLTLLLLTGVFGSVLSVKQYERYVHHLERARQYRNALDHSVSGGRLEELKKIGDEATALMFPHLSRWKLVYFWVLLHLLIAFMALMLLVGGFLGYFVCA